MTGFSVVPLQLFGLLGFLTALGGFAFGVFLLVRRLVVGAEVEGVFTLFALAFLVLGVVMAGWASSASTSGGSTSRCAAGRASSSGASTRRR